MKPPPKRAIDDKTLLWTPLIRWFKEAKKRNPKIWKAKQLEFCSRAVYTGHEMRENKKNTWILRYSKNDIAGALQFWKERPSHKSHVYAMSPDCQNRDIMYLSIIHGWKKYQGRPLISAFLKEALSTDCRYVQLHIKKNNDFLRLFYEKIGFKFVMNNRARTPRPLVIQGYLVMCLDLHASPALVKMLLKDVFQ